MNVIKNTLSNVGVFFFIVYKGSVYNTGKSF